MEGHLEEVGVGLDAAHLTLLKAGDQTAVGGRNLITYQGAIFTTLSRQDVC